MIKNFSLILKIVSISPTNAIAAQKRSLDSLAKLALGNRIALVWPLAEQGGICAVANTSGYTWINTSREVETYLCKITEQATCLKNMTCSEGSFLDLYDFGSWGPWLQSTFH